MQEDKKIKNLEQDLEMYKEMVKKLRDEKEPTITKKVAAVEAHERILAARNMGVMGIGGILLTLMVAIINGTAATITALVSIAVIGFMVVMRIREAQYLEQKYALKSKPIFNLPQQKGGFQI